MIKPEDIVLTKRDKLHILFNILNNIIPWQIVAIFVFFAVSTNTLMLANYDWYHHIEVMHHVAHFLFSVVFGLLETVCFLGMFIPTVEKIQGEWGGAEQKYRKMVIRRTEDFLLSNRRSASAEEDEE
jgi:hypothetical protein